MHFKDKVVARLRKSKAEFEQHEKTDGREAGRNWACVTAEYGQLLRVARALDGCGDVAAAVTEAILGHSFSMWQLHELWSKTGNDDPTQTYIRAFADGALELWREVAAEVQPSPGEPLGDDAPGDKAKDEICRRATDRWGFIEDAADEINGHPLKEMPALMTVLERIQGYAPDKPTRAVCFLLEALIRNRRGEGIAERQNKRPALFS